MTLIYLTKWQDRRLAYESGWTGKAVSGTSLKLMKKLGLVVLCECDQMVTDHGKGSRVARIEVSQ